MKKQFFFIYALALMAVLGFQGLARGQTDVTYCSADASYQAQFISSVKVGSIYNITLLSPGGYADYTSLWTAMAKGSGYLITVTNGFGFVSDQCAIWVDWNQDGDFTDAGEQVTVNNTPGLGPYTATITPPTTALNGNTRMRVRLSGQGSFNSCGTTMYGETEDYTINVGGTSPVNDIGVIDIITPATGTNLGSNETVKVWVYNFGTSPQAGFPVSYKVNNENPVTETISASIAPGAYYIYSFTQKVNMSGAGILYNLKSYATLTTDENHNNDTITRSIFHGWAQNAKIVQGEYFINTDPGTGNGTSITGTYNLVNVTVNINNLNLPVGSRIYVRFKSTNGTWSSPQSFKRNNYLPNSNAALASAEYFINTDPGQGNGTSTNLNNGITNITNLNLPVGSTVYVRVKDNMGRWGKPMSIKRTDYFPNTGATLNYAEYFINTDPGKGNGTPITLNSGVANITNLNIPIGSKIFVRVKDNLGRWSIPMGSERKPYFTNTGAVLSNAEYFINTDPGQGNGTPVTVSGGVINISNLNLPVNSKVYVRVKDNLGRWSMPYGMIRYVYYTIQGALLPYAEYFINTDPGQGNGIPLTIDSTGIMQLSNLNFPVNQVVYIRVKDSFNRWSFPRGYKSPSTIITPGSVLAGGEYFLNTDPGNGNGTPLTFLNGTANIDSLALHRGDVLYVRAKDTYNRWGPSRALKYHFKDMQSAEYKIKLASNGNTTLPLPMTLLSSPDSTCTWIATKDTLAWHANDTIWVRFQDKKDGLYSAWKRGVIANAGQDKIICQGEFTNLTATGGTSYLWSNGMTGASITVSPTVNTKYWVYVSDGQGDSSVDTVSVNVNPLPAAAGPIAGITEICAGNSVETYSVPVIANATSYIWTLPHGATGSSTTNNIVVNYSSSAISGNITVKGINSCGIGLLSSLGITVNSGIAGPAGIITGQEIVCQGENNVEYSIEEISNAESYVWSLPQGVNIVSGYNSNSIVVNFTNASISGYISVYGTNICGSGLESPSFYVEVDSQIGAAGNIAGMATVCQGQTGIAYSVQPIANATGYVWSVPSGTTIIEGNNTNLIFVNFSQAVISGNINVYGVNACGNGTISPTYPVMVNALPDTAGEITGTGNVYQGQKGINYSLPEISNATSYNWTLPLGATIVSGLNTNSITVDFSGQALSGYIIVNGINDCGSGYQSVFPVSVMPSHFAFEGGNPADPVWTIYISQAILDGLNLQPMDEIAIFDGTTMVGMLTLTEAPSPENVTNNYITAFKTLTNGPGYTPGHNYSFKCWDVSTQTEFNYANVSLLNPWGDAWMENVFPENDGEYSIADIDFLTDITHSYNLNTGYQFISSYITPPNPDMSVVLEELMNNNLSFVRSSGGDMFRKLGPNWVNNIGDWIVTEGYLVKMNAPDDFSITGTSVDPQTPINLNIGYQFISYLHDYPMNATTAFAGIMNDNLSFIRNSGGDMLRKLGPNWVNNIGNVNPGEGYLVKMNAPSTLIYPTGTKSLLTTKSHDNNYFVFEGGNAADPVYTIYISDATINGYSLQSGDEIGVFDGQALVGSLALTQMPTPENQTENAIPVFATLNSGEGFIANHPVTFKIWSASQGMEYDGITATMSNPYGDAYIGNVFPNSDGVYSIASLTAALTGINNPGLSEIAVYPNPNNGTFTLEFKSAQSQTFDVMIYNPLGVVVYQQLNIAANGKYLMEIDLSDLPEGIYTLMVTGKDTSYIKKMVIRK